MARVVLSSILLVAVALVCGCSLVHSGDVRRLDLAVKAVVKAPAKKVVPRRIPPVAVKCITQKSNPPFHVVNCVLQSNMDVPICARLACFPKIPAPCGAGGGTTNVACAWNINQTCISPYPIAPRARWTFGFMTTAQGTYSILPRGMGYTLLPTGVYGC